MDKPEEEAEPFIRIGIAIAPVIITNIGKEESEALGKTIADRMVLFSNLLQDSLELYLTKEKGVRYERIEGKELSEILKLTQADIRMDLNDELGRKRTN